MFQREPKLSFKLYSIQLPIIKTRSTLICFNKSPSYLSSYIRFICKISTFMFLREPKLSFKLYSIHFPIIKARSPLVCFNKNPSYLSSYILFNCQLSRQDLHSYVSTRTQAIFQAIFNSLSNYQGKISAHMF